MNGAETLGFQRREHRVRLANATRRAARREWRKVDADAIRQSYADVFPRMLALLATAQERAASGSDTFVERAIAAQGGSTREVAVNAAAWRGIASDGRSLVELLQVPVFYTINALANGAKPGEALSIGAATLDRIIGTQVVDAGRVSDGVAIVGSGIKGYTRIAAPPCCGRCAVLGGAFYKWNTGFERHPYCDCFHIPVTGSFRTGKIGSDPMELFDRGLIRGMSKSDIQAVKHGADLNQVINARRGMDTAAGRKFTREGITRRGLAGKRLQEAARLRGFEPGTPAFRMAVGMRLMPEQIYLEAMGDRQEAIRLLRRFGFIL